ncbi:hypothetical protein [Lacinutrix cladophorae]
MKKFIFKTFIFSFIVLTIFVLVCSKADGYTDPFYVRFTTPKQNSLIIGTSRAAQGLQPEVINGILKKDVFNYAFTVAHSPFGETYLNSIQKKLNSKSKHGIFIVTVDPWSLSSLSDSPDDSLSFRERKLALANTSYVNLNPNIFYILNNYSTKYYKLLNTKKTKMFLHKDGWLEVNIDLDSIDVTSKIEQKAKTYKEKHLPRAQFSKNRFEYLKKTISFLKNHGEVYLVRLPIHPILMEIENELMPRFDNDIEEALDLSDGYLDLTEKNSDFSYTDGNHLHKSSGKIVSKIVATWIDTKKSLIEFKKNGSQYIH